MATNDGRSADRSMPARPNRAESFSRIQRPLKPASVFSMMMMMMMMMMMSSLMSCFDPKLVVSGVLLADWRT